MKKKTKYIEYRGRPMVEGWTEKIAAAQLETHVHIGGMAHERIKYGNENWGWKRPDCHDCGVLKGEYHVPGCDAERCPVCADQACGCECNVETHH